MFNQRLVNLYLFENKKAILPKLITLVICYSSLLLIMKFLSDRIKDIDVIRMYFSPFLYFTLPLCFVIWLGFLLSKYIAYDADSFHFFHQKNKLYIFVFSLLEFVVVMIPLSIILCYNMISLAELISVFAALLLCGAEYYLLVFLSKNLFFAVGLLFLYMSYACFFYQGESNPLVYYSVANLMQEIYPITIILECLAALAIILLAYILNLKISEK